MRTIVYTEPGSLQVQDRPVPTPGPGEVLVRVAWAGICGSDLLLWEGGFARVTPPVVVGHEFSGVIANANGVEGIQDGDRVVVEPLLNCGVCGRCTTGNYNVCEKLGLTGIDVDGAAADYVVVPAHRIHRIPDSLSLRDAAMAEPTAVAVHMCRRAEVRPGDSVYIAGAGPIGVLVALVARAFGAARILISEPSDQRREQVAALGFETFNPVTDDAASIANTFDIGFELTGVGAAAAGIVAAVRPQATILLGGLPHKPMELPVAAMVLKELVLRGSRTYRSEDVVTAIELLDAGQVPASTLITREVAIDDAIEGAFVQLRDVRSDMKILIRPDAGGDE